MADSYSTKEITDLSTDSSVDDNDLYVVGNAGTSSMRKVTFANIAEAIKTKLLTWTFNALNTADKTLTGAINELNSSLKYESMALNETVTTAVEYLDSMPNGRIVQGHTWVRLSDMPSSLTDGLMSMIFIADKGNRAYDQVIVRKNGNEWIGYPTGSSGSLGNRSLTWVQQPTRSEYDALNSNLDVKVGSFTQASGQSITDRLTIRQSGHVVTVWGYLDNATINSGTTNIGSISGVSFPANVVRTYCNIGANAYTVGTVAYIGVTTTGGIEIVTLSGGAGSGKTIYFTASWIR